MSAAEEIRRKRAQSQVERDRLAVVDEVLWDMESAAAATIRAKGFVGVAAEVEKVRHANSVASSVQAERNAAYDRWILADRLFAKITQAGQELTKPAAEQTRHRGIGRSR